MARDTRGNFRGHGQANDAHPRVQLICVLVNVRETVHAQLSGPECPETHRDRDTIAKQTQPGRLCVCVVATRTARTHRPVGFELHTPAEPVSNSMAPTDNCVLSKLSGKATHSPEGDTDMSRAAGSSVGREEGPASPEGETVRDTEYLRTELAGKSLWVRWACKRVMGEGIWSGRCVYGRCPRCCNFGTCTGTRKGRGGDEMNRLPGPGRVKAADSGRALEAMLRPRLCSQLLLKFSRS